tara:strand:- start:27862 stop:28239 length:378 start_codon:yes stop_codon:yes gene_type:complete
MIELKDIQADRICEILDIRFHHYEKAQYKTEPYNDTDPQYYFYSESMGRYSFKLNRVSGEIMFDEFVESISSLLDMGSLTKMKEIFTNDEKMITTLDKQIDSLQENLDLKNEVKDYLLSEKLLKI